MSTPSHSSSSAIPPPPSSFTINRRRSISRSSRSSLGGGAKPISGPALASFRRASAAQNHHHHQQQQHHNAADSSALSESDIGSDGGFARMMGSFSATRDELRDSSARLASLSLATSDSLPSPFDEASSSSASDDYQSLSSPPLSEPALSTTTTTSFSPSNLALNRPSQLGKTLADRLAASGGGGPEAASPALPTIDSSPNSDEQITPTQSNIGSLAPPPPPPPRVTVSSSPSSGGGASLDRRETPTPARLKERTESHERSEPKVLGDEVGGTTREEQEEELLASQMSIREEDEEGGSLNGDGGEDAGDSGIPSSSITYTRPSPSERTPLLGAMKTQARRVSESGSGLFGGAKKRVKEAVEKVVKRGKKVGVEDVKWVGVTTVRSIPAVLLGTLMNILDGVSYGLITFPTTIPAFADFGGIGVSMFFVSCLVAQLVFSSGGSIFKGGNGSMMIEVVPFYHSIANVLAASISDDRTLVATTMFAFAMSSILTGVAFGLLGLMKLGRLSEFFPRHILVGTIGGVGAFLFVTGLQVSARMEGEDSLSFETLRRFFNREILPLWIIPLALAILLRLVTSRYSHPLIFPLYFLLIPVVFYAITFAVGWSVPQMREMGLIFEVGSVDNPWYEYVSHFSLKHTDFGAILETIPTQLALVFFGLLHVPINVPSLAISVGEDNVDTNRELVAHGVSNVLSGAVGSVPNYLVYVNSVLFYQVGGDTRLSGFLLAGGSVAVLLAGPGVIGYLPVCVVAALIFILGIDLVKEAVWDTYGRVSAGEYATIWGIVLTMTIADFVWGLLAGVVLASVHFVILSSQRRAIRTILTGTVARSTVRRHPKQSAFLQEVGRQIRVVKLQGFLFFGTISNVEATVRKLLDAASWSSNPIRFLVVDFGMASGVDFSAAEAFVRMQRLLDERGVVLVLCGCPADSSVGVALRSVDLWSDHAENKVIVLENLNDALEHCENSFLRSLYSKTFRPPVAAHPSGTAYHAVSQIDMPKADLDSDIEGFAGSPRAMHLRTAARETISRTESPQGRLNFQQPLPILLQAFQPYSPELNEDYCFRLVPYFKRVNVARGTSLWTSGSAPDAFYVIESGMLRANYTFSDRSHSMSESMVAGTVAGELSFLSRTKRNTNVVAERDSVLWKMDVVAHEELGKKEGWAFARRFEEVVLKIAVAETEVLMGHLMTRTS